MKTDKNTVIGFVLLGILFFTYFWYNNKQQTAYLTEKKRFEDSIAVVNAAKARIVDTVAAKIETAKKDSAIAMVKAGRYVKSGIGTEETRIVENDVMKVTFTNKGGRVKFVELKKYNSFDGTPVKLGDERDTLGYLINTAANNSASTNDLFFTASAITKNADGSETISYSLQDSANAPLVHKFTISPNQYHVQWDIVIQQPQVLFTNNQMNLSWQSRTTQHEKSAVYERDQMSNICFVEDKEFDYIMRHTEKKFEKPVNWLSVVQQFFNTTLIAKHNFNSGNVSWQKNTVLSKDLARVDANFQIQVPATNNVTIPLEIYYGPNDYSILKTQAPEMDRIINLGRDMYSFVRPVNKYVIMPVFTFFASFIKNFGWVILLLTLFIRLITAPLMYGSYVSGAKMKLLRPELDALKKKFGSDQQGFAMEQMKLFKDAGASPLSGCIPALLQIPIFFALYSFFNSNIALRGQPFLWSHDLSAFDVFFSWKTEIWGFGNHISLFMLTAVITNFFISVYNMSSQPAQDNPAMKYMPYIFPFILLFFFNNLPSALTWYYTVSNVITISLQFVIQKYIIDHDKIMAKMQEKRSAPKTKSKWQEKYEQVMDSQKKLQDMKTKNQGRK